MTFLSFAPLSPHKLEHFHQFDVILTVQLSLHIQPIPIDPWVLQYVFSQVSQFFYSLCHYKVLWGKIIYEILSYLYRSLSKRIRWQYENILITYSIYCCRSLWSILVVLLIFQPVFSSLWIFSFVIFENCLYSFSSMFFIDHILYSQNASMIAK